MSAQHTPGPWFISKVAAAEYVRASLHYEAGPAGLISNIEDARLIAAAPELLEACKTFAEWLRREETGFVAAGKSRDTPEGEAEWREWFYENLRICDLAQEQARAAIVKATGGQS